MALTDIPAVPAPVSPWQCECGCRQRTFMDEHQPGGGYAPGPSFRCVNCKRETIVRSPASRSGEDHAAAIKVAGYIAKRAADTADPFHLSMDSDEMALLARCYLALVSRDSGEAVKLAARLRLLVENEDLSDLDDCEKVADMIEALSASAARLTKDNKRLREAAEWAYKFLHEETLGYSDIDDAMTAALKAAIFSTAEPVERRTDAIVAHLEQEAERQGNGRIVQNWCARNAAYFRRSGKVLAQEAQDG